MKQIQAKDVKSGMVILNPDVPRLKRIALTDAQKTHKGYIRVETSEAGNPLNVHGTQVVYIEG